MMDYERDHGAANSAPQWTRGEFMRDVRMWVVGTIITGGLLLFALLLVRSI